MRSNWFKFKFLHLVINSIFCIIRIVLLACKFSSFIIKEFVRKIAIIHSNVTDFNIWLISRRDR